MSQIATTVCLCTYNGGRFLRLLLRSLAVQTVLPTCLLVGDDGSSDETLEILRDFASGAPFPVEIVENARRLGPAGNLENLVARSTGEILFLCDQDDIWAPTKIEVLIKALENPLAPPAVISNSSLIDGRGSSLPGSLYERAGLDRFTRELLATGSSAALVEIARHNVVASHALAVRRTALDLVLPFGSGWQADWWMALVLSATTGITVLEERLVEYRLHELNTVGLRKRRPLVERLSLEGAERFSSRADMLEAALVRVSKLRPDIPTPSDRAVLGAQIAHLRTRAGLPPRRARRVVPVLREARKGGYRRFSNGWASAFGDVVRLNG